jgi:hypothetical protein
MVRFLSFLFGAALCLVAATAHGNRPGRIEVRVTVHKSGDLVASPSQATLPGQAALFRLGVEPRPVKLTVTPHLEGDMVRLVVERNGRKPLEITLRPDEAAPIEDIARGYLVSVAAR